MPEPAEVKNPIPASPAMKTAARMAAVQALYAIEITGRDPDAVQRDFIDRVMPVDADMPIPDAFDPETFRGIVHEVCTKETEIDPQISACLDPKWPFTRLEKILKAILRAGASELIQGKVDVGIIINDYVSVTHGFFEGKEPALVNAVLDKLAKTIKST
jgi:N utilization substance protein B